MNTRRLASLALRLVALALGAYLVFFAVRSTIVSFPSHPPEYPVADGGSAFAGAFLPPIAAAGGLLVGFAAVRSSERLRRTYRRLVVYPVSAFLATSLPVVYLNVWAYGASKSGLTHLDWYVPAAILCLVVATFAELGRDDPSQTD